MPRFHWLFVHLCAVGGACDAASAREEDVVESFGQDTKMARTARMPLGSGALLVTVLIATAAMAQDGTEPLGGQPPPGSAASTKDFDYQIKYQRAFEAVLWGIPAAAIYSFRRAAFDDLGLKDNDIIAYSATATPKLEAITANSTTPYITAFSDLRKGPVVLELPVASAEGSVYG